MYKFILIQPIGPFGPANKKLIFGASLKRLTPFNDLN